MALPVHTLTCTKKEKIARDVYDIRFTKPEGFVFKPGQFVLFDVPLVENPGDIQTRAFSLASTPSEPELTVVAKMKEGGRASRWIEEILEIGTPVAMKGPFGNFKLDTQTDKDYLFVATSTGVGPFRPMILEALERGDSRKMDLIFGVRSEEDLFWQEEFERMSQTYENFFLHIALSGPSEAWTGHRGRVQTLMPHVANPFFSKNIYVCGSPDMTKDLKKHCLEDWGVQKQDLHVEGYI